MRARGLAGGSAADQDFEAELASHLEMYIEDEIRAGLTPAEARRQVLIKLGGVASTVELHREQRGIPFFEPLGTPLRRGGGFSFRDTERSPSVVIINEALAREWRPQQNPIRD